jgi:Homeodomain-like domain
MTPRSGSENENAASRRRSRPDSEGQGSKLDNLQERLFIPEQAPFGDSLGEYGSIRRDLGRAGLIDNNADGPVFRAPWPGTSVHEGAEAPGWGSEELPDVASERTLLEARIRKAAQASVAAGCRPLGDTVAERRQAVAIAASVARYLAARGRDPMPALSQYLRRKRELGHAQFQEALWGAVGRLFENPKARRERLRAEILADREAGLSIRQIAQARGIPRSTVARQSQKWDT